MFRVTILTVVLLVSVESTHAQDVFGTWHGFRYPTEMFTGDGIPFGTPPFDPFEMELVLHPFDAATQRFGTVVYINTGGDNVAGGNIVALSQVDDNVSLTLFAPAEGEPTGYADIAAVLAGNTLEGTFNTRSPAAPGFVHVRGTMSLMRVVPEPSSTVLLLAAGGIATWHRRPRCLRTKP